MSKYSAVEKCAFEIGVDLNFWPRSIDFVDLRQNNVFKLLKNHLYHFVDDIYLEPK